MPETQMIHVQRNGTILVDGEAVGIVEKMPKSMWAMGVWRAEVGEPGKPEGYRAAYAKTRKAAVREVLKP
jgi:hypothetical protein